MCCYAYDVKTAKIFGINSAVLLNVINMFKDSNNTAIIDTDSLFNITGLDQTMLKNVEDALTQANIITVKCAKNSIKHTYTLNIKNLVDIFNNYDYNYMVNSFVPNNTTSTKRTHMTQKAKHIITLKHKINTDDTVLNQYLCDWVDAVYQNPKGFITDQGLVIAINDLLKYDKEQQYAILKIAIKNGYRDLEWAMNKINVSGATSNFANYTEIKSDGTNIIDEEF